MSVKAWVCWSACAFFSVTNLILANNTTASSVYYCGMLVIMALDKPNKESE